MVLLIQGMSFLALASVKAAQKGVMTIPQTMVKTEKYLNAMLKVVTAEGDITLMMMTFAVLYRNRRPIWMMKNLMPSPSKSLI